MAIASPTASSPTLEERLIDHLAGAIAQAFPDTRLPVGLERTRQASHGDYATPVALQLAKQLRRPPRDVAAMIISHLPPSVLIERAELAGAGFINLFLSASARQSVVSDIITAGEQYGQITVEPKPSVLVEFVSSNPTGPLHVGHGRGAAFGASLANLLQKAGYAVAREYYVNDAGRQMDILTVSTWLRALALSGHDGFMFPFPANGYQGDYVQTLAQTALPHMALGQPQETEQALRSASPHLVQDTVATEWEETHMDGLIALAKARLGPIYAQLHGFVLADQVADCRQDLQEFGVTFDTWFSEQSLFDTGAVASVVSRLAEAGQLYEQNGAQWFRSSAWGDEKDRVVQRDNGLFTYFASDIAYHVNKFERGFDRLINVWGADHHGYIPRVVAALQALGYATDRLTVPLVQFVSLFRHGEKAQMSTRKGQFVTLRNLRQEVGCDAARLFYVLRKSDQHLDFDLDLALAQSQDNPVYYIQYAHARIARVLQRWGGDIGMLASVDLSPLTHSTEVALFQSLRAYPPLIQQAAHDLAPHQLAFYLRDLAAEFHGYYNAVPFLDCEQSLARLTLLRSIQLVLRDGLGLLGVSAPDTM